MLWSLLRTVRQRQSQSIDFSETDRISTLEFSVLSAITSNPGIDQKTVTTTTFISKSNLVGVLGRLEDRHLIWIAQSRTDGRRSSLYPTFEGRSFSYSATRMVLRRNQQFLDVLGDDRDAFLRLLEHTAFYGQEERRSHYIITSPDESGPPITVTWGIGRLLRASIQRYTRLWSATIPFPTAQQYAVLRTIRLRPGISQVALGEALSTSSASIAEMIARLLGRELVARHRDVSDARRAVLSLTPKGEALLDSTELSVKQTNTEFFVGLREGDSDFMIDCLRRLTVADADD